MPELQAKNLLHDFYGGLLTEKQSAFFTMHYMDDYSLAEIGAHFGVTPQAVADTLKRAGKLLDGYEEKLGLVKKLTVQKETAQIIQTKLDALEKTNGEHEVISQVKELLKEMVL